jgi:pimeloyl-ACP methyl ester carboxylesterase
VLLLNAGAVHHVGPNRLHVALARRLAALGHTVLRMDLSGLGDSRARPDIAENKVYSTAAMEDVLVGLAHLAFRTGGAPCAAVGLCSGAYHAFKAAVKGLPLSRVIAINPLTFFWKAGQPLEIAAAHRVVSESRRVMSAARSAAAWRRALSGKGNLRRAIRVVGLRAAAELRSLGRRIARRAGYPLSDDLPSDLLTIARNGVDLCFVFADGDPGLSLLRMQGGAHVHRLQERGRLHISVVTGPDHTFTQVWSHEPLLELLIDEITRPLPK